MVEHSDQKFFADWIPWLLRQLQTGMEDLVIHRVGQIYTGNWTDQGPFSESEFTKLGVKTKTQGCEGLNCATQSFWFQNMW